MFVDGETNVQRPVSCWRSAASRSLSLGVSQQNQLGSGMWFEQSRAAGVIQGQFMLRRSLILSLLLLGVSFPPIPPPVFELVCI